MSRFARDRRVFFFEEPVFEGAVPYLRATACAKTGVQVLTPILPRGLNAGRIADLQRELLASIIAQNHIQIAGQVASIEHYHYGLAN